MENNVFYVLIHSPLVGPSTWELVYQVMRAQGINVIVPRLLDDPASHLPYWQQHAKSVAKSLAEIPSYQKIILVAHSGAGPLLPAIRQSLMHSVAAYVFVDAGIPRNGLSRIELMSLEDQQWAEQFHRSLLQGEQFPDWNEDDLQEVIPDCEVRRTMIADMHPRSLPFFEEPIPVYDAWPDTPCIYIKFSKSYDWDAAYAKRAGWSVYEMNVGHFHILVEPLTVADLLVNSVNKQLDVPGAK
ncbi:MAG: alpha/beta hydrolase [Chloroflexota bacterium]